MFTLDGVEMLDVREAARVAGRSPETVRRWIWSGRLVASRHGNRLLVTRAALEALLGSDSSAGGAADLAGWAAEVRRQRRKGLLGESAEHASAADLVLADRADRGRS